MAFQQNQIMPNYSSPSNKHKCRLYKKFKLLRTVPKPTLKSNSVHKNSITTSSQTTTKELHKPLQLAHHVQHRWRGTISVTTTQKKICTYAV